MSTALGDLVVLDLTGEFWSSIGVGLLADFGARVIKVEEVQGARGRRTNGADPQASWDYLFELANRNKRSLALKLDSEDGREILRELVREADVVIADQPMDGWDYAALAALKPDLIYVHASGFGPRGPDRDLPAFDEFAAARTGAMPTLPQPGQPPVYSGAGQMYTAVMIAFGVATALQHRVQTGEGQQVDVSLFAGNMYGASLDIQAYLAIRGDRLLHPVSRMDAGNPMSGTLYLTKDERWVTLTMPDTDRWWPGLSEITGIDPQDPRFDSHENRCDVNRLELIRVLEETIPSRPRTSRPVATATSWISSTPASVRSRCWASRSS
jgi:formyl-CoA transferase